MAITITCLDDANHSISSSKKILSRQGELGETITFSLPSTLNVAYPRAWIMVQQPDGQLYYIDNGSGAGFTWPNPYTFTYNIGDRDTMLSSDGTLGIQVVLRDDTPPAQTVEWRSRILYLTIEGSILSNVDSGGSLIDSLSSGTLNRLADIQYDSLADGDLLYRDTTTGKWRNVTLVDGANISHVLNKTTGELTLQATGNISTLASDLIYTDAGGYYTGSDGETISQEIGAKLVQLAQIGAVQTDIILRDILRIKMRQTGLNLDPNAWSDSLEDGSGINESLSTTDIGAVGSLTAVKYSTKYTADALPQNSTPAWTKETSGSPTESVSDGKLTINSGSTNGNYIKYTRESSGISASLTKEFSFRLKILSGGTTSIHTSALFVEIFDGVRAAQVCFNYGGYVVYLNNSIAWTQLGSQKNFSSDYFVVKILFNNSSGLTVYVNGVLQGTVAYSGLATTSTNRLNFQAYNGGSTTSAIIDYIQYTLDNSVTSPATVVWDAQTSSGTLTDAVVEAVESLGTGSITYYISRDGGTTFTACTLDTVTDISAQPSGTSIVLKAVISGNAELLAVAWGGQA